jgi:hypothetical protein
MAHMTVLKESGLIHTWFSRSRNHVFAVSLRRLFREEEEGELFLVLERQPMKHFWEDTAQ